MLANRIATLKRDLRTEFVKDELGLVCEFNGLQLSDLVYFDDDKIAAISQSRSTISIYSISKRMTLIENAIPSQSISRIWSYKKTCFISDQENCIFVVREKVEHSKF